MRKSVVLALLSLLPGAALAGEVFIEGVPIRPHDVLERSAILEFCAGLPRDEAEALAFAEFGCTTLSPGLKDLMDLEDKPSAPKR